MISLSLQNRIKSFVAENLGVSISYIGFSMVGGGSINQTYQLLINKKEKFFCKINSSSLFPQMFEKERKGLALLASKKIIRVPAVIGTLLETDNQVLLLEWIEQGIKTEKFWRIFGEQLSGLHTISHSYAGLEEDNYMGALTQSNQPSTDWIEFFIQQRIEPQVRLAMDKKLLETHHLKDFERCYKVLPSIFPQKQFSLLHGDIWSGNFLCDDTGMPVLIDPAVYYGHPSMDLGMTTLFGGFDPLFYDSYNHQLPFPSNFRQQWEICNLYPLLIHLNLFGKGYLHNILSTLQYY